MTRGVKDDRDKPSTRADAEDTVPQLSDSEIEEVRKIIEQQKRVKWLWGTLRTYAMWITAVVAGYSVGWDMLKKVLASLTQGGGKP